MWLQKDSYSNGFLLLPVLILSHLNVLSRARRLHLCALRRANQNDDPNWVVIPASNCLEAPVSKLLALEEVHPYNPLTRILLSCGLSTDSAHDSGIRRVDCGPHIARKPFTYNHGASPTPGTVESDRTSTPSFPKI